MIAKARQNSRMQSRRRNLKTNETDKEAPFASGSQEFNNVN